MSLASLRTHTDAVIDKLEAAGLSVGNAEGKDASGGDLSQKYAVVYPIPGGRFFGTLGELNGFAELVYQVTCVGSTSEQALWVADKAMTLLDGITVTGRRIRVFLDDPSGVRRDDAGPDTLFYATPRFRLTSTPT